jgi:3-phenylpropionate/trans-cinnamate dioxygenase ferredoxin reductase subunit
MSNFVIVGTGNAGLGAALELRRQGFDGRVLMLGAEAHLPYERPPLSKAQLAADGLAMPLLQSADLLAAQHIELRTGCTVERLDTAAARLHLADGGSEPYDELLLATGGRARALDRLPGGQHALTLRSYDDSLALRARLAAPPGRLVVVGAGVIGLEVAATARGLGWRVTVLESGNRALARMLAPEISGFIADIHAGAGVDLRFGVSLQALEPGADGRIGVLTSDGALDADLVVAGIGMQPDTALAAAAGIEAPDGIAVDEYARSSTAHVHAAGDAALLWHPRFNRRLRFESWQHAARHGATAARTMLGRGEPYDDVPWSWTDQYDVNLQVLGLPAEADRTLLRGHAADRKFVALHLRQRRLVGATLVNLGREMRPCKALIESGAELDLVRLSDPAVSLREYAAHMAATA